MLRLLLSAQKKNIKMKNIFNFKHFKGDMFGGITAGVVALPLALAFGVQSGMGAIAGLYGAMVLGMFAALFGGTATQVSGPTGPMTVVSATVVVFAIKTMGDLDAGMGMIIAVFLLAGLLQIVFGLLKIGKYIRYIPYPVLSGFMTGIGAIIILFQVFPFFGLSSPRGTIDVVMEIATPLTSFNAEALGLGALTIAIIYLFPKLTKAVPSTLVALLVVTIISVLMSCEVPIIGDIPSGIPELKIGELASIKPELYTVILEYGITLAALGAIDSLLTSVIADNITKTQHNSNRELIGQGIGNMAAALIGGLPGAGATMRTVVNVNSGGKTRLSGFIHGVFLLTVLLGLGKYAAYIPLSVLAGILITVGIGIIDYKGLRHLKRVPRTDAVILVMVLIMTVFVDLLTAVGVGVLLACVLYMKKASDLAESGATITSLSDHGDDIEEDEIEAYQVFKGQIYIKHLSGQLFFGFTAGFKEMQDKINDGVRVLIIRMEKVPHIDQSGIYAIEEVIMDLQQRDVLVLLTGVQPQPCDMLKKIDVLPALIPDDYAFETFEECKSWLKYNLNSEDGSFDKIIKELHEVKKAKVAYRM